MSLFIIYIIHRTQYICYFYFFFQAEDGIRDPLVTGVQTCALPISAATSRRCAESCRRRRWCSGRRRRRSSPTRTHRRGSIVCRSEERRVGKECRSRRTQYHVKNNNNLGGKTVVIKSSTNVMLRTY